MSFRGAWVWPGVAWAVLGLAACGGGGGGGSDDAAGLTVAAAAPVAPVAAVAVQGALAEGAAAEAAVLNPGAQDLLRVPAPAPEAVAEPTPTPTPTPTPEPPPVTDAPPAAPAAATPPAQPAASAPVVAPLALQAPAPVPVTLASLATTPNHLLADVGATTGCRAAYVPPAALVATAALPVQPPLLFDAADLVRARQQLTAGPFLRGGDFSSGSPAEMQRLQTNARSFDSSGETTWLASNVDSLRATHGSLARDAAFMHLLQPSATRLAAVRRYLLREAANAANDLAALLCLREADGSMRDAWYGEASWLARYAATYDAVRASLPATDRLPVENFIRRNAYFLAAQLDYGFQYLFPERLSGDYARRGASAAAQGDDAWATRRMDTNGDCSVNNLDTAAALPVYAYAHADGTAGPRLSVLSQWYNNRKSVSALAIGLAGLLLDDSALQLRAQRYVMEWITYAVWADGSEGEYLRNGDYCVPSQGLVYAASNVQAAMLLADLQARRGDRTLLDFSTRDGLFGSEAAPAQPAKSVATVVATHLDLARGQRAWYQHRPWLARQQVDASTHLGRPVLQIFNAARPTDDFHHLGFLLAAKHFPSLPIAGFVLRDATVTQQHFPGATGNAVATGYGSWWGAWTDTFNLYASALWLRAP